MSDITPTSAATQRTSADILQSIDNTVAKLTGGDAEKTKELFREVANIISGVSVRVSNGGTSGVDGNRDTTRTNGGTSTPSLDNPGDPSAREANLEKLIAYLQLDNEQRQTEMAKDRIEMQQNTLDAEHDDRMKQIDESIKKMKDSESASKWSRAFSWIGAILSVVAAVALTIVTGGAAAGFAIAGAVLAVTALTLNETGAMETITKKLAESIQSSFGSSKSDAQLAATLIINIGIIALSAGCSIGGMVAGFSSAASSAANVAKAAAEAADVANKSANAASEATTILGMSMQTAKTVQNVISVASTATAASALATGGINTYYTKRSDDAKADTTELQKFITQLQQRLDESEEELQQLLQQIEAGLSEIAQIVGSVTDTSDEIAKNIGQMA